MFSIFLPEAARLALKRLSRGAASVLFVDEDRQSIVAIEKNLGKANFRARVREQDVFHFLKRFSSAERFDIIFADPPYEKTKAGEAFTDKLLSNEALPELITPGGVFVLEKGPDERSPETKLWEVIRRKNMVRRKFCFATSAK